MVNQQDSNNNTLKKKERDSNMELLRIIAMLLVTIVHCNFVAIGMPTQADVIDNPSSSLMRFLTQSISIICVNLFVLISGWYGIRPTIKKFLNLLFQVFFFSFLCFGIFAIIAPQETLCFKGFEQLLLLDGHLWFVKSYVALFILSPILNAYVKQASKRSFAVLLIAFYVFQFIYGWLFPATVWFAQGYSALSFVGLYLLARFAQLYGSDFLSHRKALLGVATLSIISCTLLSFIAVKMSKGWVAELFYGYDSIFTMTTSVCVASLFTQFHFYNKSINLIGSSIFSVYLFHCNPFVFTLYYVPSVIRWHNTLDTAAFVGHCALLIVFVFVVSFIIDQARLFVWKRIATKVK